MGIRVTTWNVNGIRNPFGYQPWRDKRTFEGMFDILEADVVVFQETKIQRKDLRDDMVLVPGWDCYWSLPKHKKGYSGVVIYTRNATCAPIRAEEGITGILTPPNSTSSFRELPDEERIGGYPNAEQMSRSTTDPVTLDSEGRCVILEFPAFVLIGTYCPAQRDDTRTEFRDSFLQVLDARIRNLVAMGKRVIWTGDLNISREELDTAPSEEMIRKNEVDYVEWISSPARRLLNQLLVQGKVYGERDKGREDSVLWDVCRAFHPGRKGMYTCWETKVNARPGNFGARIDYVLCSAGMKDWWSDSNIQEGLMGSDHCPVYGVMKDQILVDGEEVHAIDLMNPKGMFVKGKRIEPWSNKHLLPMSGKLITEFDRRRNIRDMFSRKPSAPLARSETEVSDYANGTLLPTDDTTGITVNSIEPVVPADIISASQSTTATMSPAKPSALKRQQTGETPPAKRAKSNGHINVPNGAGKGQQSLKGFFKAKPVPAQALTGNDAAVSALKIATPVIEDHTPISNPTVSEPQMFDESLFLEQEASNVESKQTWGKLFARPIAPKCEHDEPCKTMLTKKPGVNCGRSFWMCNRPLGPSGNKERGSQWRCATFIWASEWDGHAGEPG